MLDCAESLTLQYRTQGSGRACASRWVLESERVLRVSGAEVLYFRVIKYALADILLYVRTTADSLLKSTSTPDGVKAVTGRHAAKQPGHAQVYGEAADPCEALTSKRLEPNVLSKNCAAVLNQVDVKAHKEAHGKVAASIGRTLMLPSPPTHP